MIGPIYPPIAFFVLSSGNNNPRLPNQCKSHYQKMQEKMALAETQCIQLKHDRNSINVDCDNRDGYGDSVTRRRRKTLHQGVSRIKFYLNNPLSSSSNSHLIYPRPLEVATVPGGAYTTGRMTAQFHHVPPTLTHREIVATLALWELGKGNIAV